VIGSGRTSRLSKMKSATFVGACVLHRKEGDDGDAAYWYSRAGKPVCREPVDAEWISIATALLE